MYKIRFGSISLEIKGSKLYSGSETITVNVSLVNFNSDNRESYSKGFRDELNGNGSKFIRNYIESSIEGSRLINETAPPFDSFIQEALTDIENNGLYCS